MRTEPSCAEMQLTDQPAAVGEGYLQKYPDCRLHQLLDGSTHVVGDVTSEAGCGSVKRPHLRSQKGKDLHLQESHPSVVVTEVWSAEPVPPIPIPIQWVINKRSKLSGFLAFPFQAKGIILLLTSPLCVRHNQGFFGVRK